MARALLRARLPFRGVTVPRVPVLYGRIPVSPSANYANLRSFMHSRRFNQELSAATELNIDMDEEKVTFTGWGLKPVVVSYIELRDRCKCPLCVDRYSKQRNFRLSDIPLGIKPRSITPNGDVFEVTWKSDVPGYDSSHVSRFSREQLKKPWKHSSARSTTYVKRHRYLWNRDLLEYMQPWISYEDYMHDDTKFTRAMRYLSCLGILFLRDIPDSREMVEKIATRIGPLRNTFYGPTWDVRTIPKAKNVAYTNQFLGFHMDLMYMNEAPGYQLLHCLRNSCDGGESLFADTFKTADYMWRNQKRYFEALSNLYIPYEYMHPDHQYSKWRPVFEKGPFSTDGDVKAVNYSPPFQGPLQSVTTGSKLEIAQQKLEMEALNFFANSLERKDQVFELKLEPGECVIFENRRVVHARRQFNTASGERWLAGAYLDSDELLSRFRVLEDANPDAWACGLGQSISVTKRNARENAPRKAREVMEPGEVPQ
ncbi:putative Gamma-butyrobetaine hydroxylase subfamily [Aspergillus undulatus]|uniref:putative Gamma-butyrobetaine hydroxylase subfamily n=1 Tax=Aspergillus undulatus TaxID=1810928 RepID=UPI003CCD4344